jgi:hypothetical protein
MRLIVPLAAALSLTCAVTAIAQSWTWTLYESRTSLALANEIPDTPQLAAVLECTPGSGQAKVSIYPTGERTRPVVGDYKTTNAAFAAFVQSGKLSMKTDAGEGQIEMDAEHRPKLERFARLCGA